MAYGTLGLAQAHIRTDFVLKVPMGGVVLSKDRKGMIEYGFAYGVLPRLTGAVAEPIGWHDGRSASGCLDSFTRLHDAPDAEIAEFAQERGILGICEHGLPGIHASCRPSLYFPSSLDPSSTPILWPLGEERPWRESTEDWRSLARHLRAITRFAYATTHDETPDFDDGLHLDWPSSAPPPIFGNPAPWLPAAEQFYLNRLGRMGQAPPASSEGVSLAVNRLLQLAHIGPTIQFEKSDYWLSFAFKRPTEEAPVFVWPGEMLFPALVAQLASALVSEEHVRCVWCGEVFLAETRYPKRMPRRDRGATCSAACKKARKREKNAASMRRNRTPVPQKHKNASVETE